MILNQPLTIFEVSHKLDLVLEVLVVTVTNVVIFQWAGHSSLRPRGELDQSLNQIELNEFRIIPVINERVKAVRVEDAHIQRFEQLWCL